MKKLLKLIALITLSIALGGFLVHEIHIRTTQARLSSGFRESTCTVIAYDGGKVVWKSPATFFEATRLTGACYLVRYRDTHGRTNTFKIWTHPKNLTSDL